MDKTEFRTQAKGTRANVHNREEQERGVLALLQANPALQYATHVASYVSMGTELGTGEMNRWLIGEKKLYLPRVEGENIRFYQVTDPKTQLKRGNFGILEPVDGLHPMERVDVVLVPGLAFSQEGHRLGYGGGFYDRFFQGVETHKIGLCFKEQMNGEVPTEKWDIFMDEVVYFSI